jgi:hypothetical protein
VAGGAARSAEVRDDRAKHAGRIPGGGLGRQLAKPPVHLVTSQRSTGGEDSKVSDAASAGLVRGQAGGDALVDLVEGGDCVAAAPRRISRSARLARSYGSDA